MIKKIIRKGAKNYFTGDDSLAIDSNQESIKGKINEKARSLLKQAINDPGVLIDYIKSNRTKVVKSRFMDRILALFGEEEGFITPMKGWRALFFTLIINISSPVKVRPGFSTPALFALNSKPVNIYTLAYQFHLWLSYINDLPGFEEETIKNYRKYWQAGPNSEEVSHLPMEDLVGLKDIIAREQEAISFVEEMGRELVGQKESLEKLKKGDSINL